MNKKNNNKKTDNKSMILRPEIEKINKDISLEQFKNILGDNSAIELTENNDTEHLSDNFFREVIIQFLNRDNISLKTEWVNLNEIFSAVKLEFLSIYADMPYAHDFIEIMETKRVSNGRKSRIELSKIFQKKDEDIQAESRIDKFKQAINM